MYSNLSCTVPESYSIVLLEGGGDTTVFLIQEIVSLLKLLLATSTNLVNLIGMTIKPRSHIKK